MDTPYIFFGRAVPVHHLQTRLRMAEEHCLTRDEAEVALIIVGAVISNRLKARRPRKAPIARVYLGNVTEVILGKGDAEFQRLFRVTRSLFNELCVLLKAHVESDGFAMYFCSFLNLFNMSYLCSSHSAETQLLVYLKYVANVSSFNTVGDDFGMPPSSAYRCVCYHFV